MSIEALLIAAKYVELTDEPTDGKANTVSDVETRSQPSASNGELGTEEFNLLV